jgi:predicted ester cyclase
MTMTPRSPAEILDRNITALNNRDLDAYLANQRPDVEFVVPGGITLRGREQVRQSTQAYWTAFPDGKITFGQQVLGDDSAATEVIFTGTHTGPLPTPNGDLPPTNRPVRIVSMSMLRFADGLVASEHVYMNQLELMTQLGLGPAEG